MGRRVPASWRDFFYVWGVFHTRPHARSPSRSAPASAFSLRWSRRSPAMARPWLLGWCLRRGRPVARGLEPRAASQQDARAHNWGAQHRHGPPAHLQDQDTSCPTLPRARWELDGGRFERINTSTQSTQPQRRHIEPPHRARGRSTQQPRCLCLPRASRQRTPCRHVSMSGAGPPVRSINEGAYTSRTPVTDK